MKYLFLLLVVLLVIWAVKRGRQAPRKPATPKTSSPSEMVSCSHCGIHLPLDEAVSGEKGAYCSTDHRTAAHDRNPH
jgi:uncharacterized protein